MFDIAVFNIINAIIAWATTVALLLAFPISEAARGMASNPGAHPMHKGAMLASALGAALLAMLVFG